MRVWAWYWRRTPVALPVLHGTAEIEYGNVAPAILFLHNSGRTTVLTSAITTRGHSTTLQTCRQATGTKF